MTRINLLPPDYAKKRKTRRILISLALVPVLILVGLGAHYSVKLDEKRVVLNDIADYEAKIAELQPIVDEMERLAAKEEMMEKKIQAINALSKEKHSMVYLFEEINSVIPENLWLKGFTKKEGEKAVSFNGTAMSNFEVARLMVELMRSPYFDKVELKVIKESVVDRFRVKDFEVTCELKDIDEGV